MIPTLIVLGLLLGRWWWQTLLAAAVGWPLLLVMEGVITADAGLAGALVFGVGNAAAGVLMHQAVLRLVRKVRTLAKSQSDRTHI